MFSCDFLQVRDLWRKLDEFRTSIRSERDSIEAVLGRELEHAVLDAGSLKVTVPDLLLRHCEAEIQRVSLIEKKYLFKAFVF